MVIDEMKPEPKWMSSRYAVDRPCSVNIDIDIKIICLHFESRRQPIQTDLGVAIATVSRPSQVKVSAAMIGSFTSEGTYSE
jgi:hypothetical protein